MSWLCIWRGRKRKDKFLGIIIKKGMTFSVKYSRTFQNCPKLSTTSSFKVLSCLHFRISKGRQFFPGRVVRVSHGSLWHTVPSDICWDRYFQETEDWPATLAVPLVFAFAPKANKKRERKNGALVPCCTDISMLHSYLNICYNIWFLRKQNINATYLIWTPLEERNSEFSI